MSRTPRRLLAIVALPVMLGALGCGGSAADPVSGDRTALLHAEAQWSAAAIHNYNYDLVTSFAAAHDSVQVQVRSDQVALSKSYLSGQTSPAGETVPGFFTAVDDAIVSGLSVQVSYDPQLGYPAIGSVGSKISTPAGPSTWRIVNFTRLP